MKQFDTFKYRHFHNDKTVLELTVKVRKPIKISTEDWNAFIEAAEKTIMRDYNRGK